MSCAVQSAASRCGPALYVNAPAAESAWPIVRTANTLLAGTRGTAGTKKKLHFRKQGEPEP